jgi:hypothetical protein
VGGCQVEAPIANERGAPLLCACQDPEHVKSTGLLSKLGFTPYGTVVPPGESTPVETWQLVP